MVNKAKKQGTTYETNIVNRLNKNDNFKVQRLAEGGSLDKGDIELVINNKDVLIIVDSSVEKKTELYNKLKSICSKIFLIQLGDEPGQVNLD